MISVGDRASPGDTAAEEFHLPDSLDGERIDRIVAVLTGCSRADAARLINGGGVTIAGEVVSKLSRRPESGDVLTIDHLASEDSLPEANPDVAIDVVHCDQHVLVLNKPPGLVVHPGAGHADDTMVNGLLVEFPELKEVGDAQRPGIVHRLDKGTSGLLAVARTQLAYESLSQQLRSREVLRRYRAMVMGRLSPELGSIEVPIARSRHRRDEMTTDRAGKYALTHYEVTKQHSVEDHQAKPGDLQWYSEVSCRLATGRTHQIRVHMAAISHPIVGDDTYGPSRTTTGLERPFLHATELGFLHPESAADMRFESPLPEDLAEFADSVERRANG